MWARRENYFMALGQQAFEGIAKKSLIHFIKHTAGGRDCIVCGERNMAECGNGSFLLHRCQILHSSEPRLSLAARALTAIVRSSISRIAARTI